MPSKERTIQLLSVVFIAWSLVLSAAAQQSPTAVTSTSTSMPASSPLPNLVNYSGTLKDVTGKTLTELSGVTFLLYKDEQGGTPLWMETQNVTPDSVGHYSVQLGSTTAKGIPTNLFQTGQARWLAVQIAGEAEQPRVMLVAVAYAMKAADAETLGGHPASAYMLAPNTSTGAVNRQNAALSVSRQSAGGYSGLNIGPKKAAGPATIGGGGTAGYLPVWIDSADLGNSAFFQNSAGQVGLGTTTPVSALTLNGTLAFTNTTTPLLYNDSAAGKGILRYSRMFWAYSPQTSNFGIYWDDPHNRMIWQTDAAHQFLTADFVNKRVGVGTTTPAATLDVNGTVSASSATVAGGVSAASVFGSSVAPNSESVIGSNLDSTTQNYGVYGVTGSPVFAAAGVRGDGPGFGVLGISSSSIESPGSGVLGWAVSNTGIAQGVQGFSSSPAGIGVYGAVVSPSASGSALLEGFPFGVWGDTNQFGGVGLLGTEDDGTAGLFVNNNNNTDNNDPTLSAFNNGTGLVFSAVGPTGSCTIDGNGNLNCFGAASAAQTNLRIDHPLDPANKYLNHSSVESSEMMNIYTGNVTTDGQGEAIVRMPDWFEAVNGDFRYQLTVIGQFAQAIVAREIQNHEFTIKTSVPNVKVSWQVTGVRQDRWAKAHPLVAEQEKEAKVRGSYIHPELYGAGKERGIGWAQRPELIKRAQARHGQPSKSGKSLTPSGRPPVLAPPTLKPGGEPIAKAE